MSTKVLNPAAAQEPRPQEGAGRIAVWSAVAAAWIARLAVIFVTRSYLFPPPAPVHDPAKLHWQFGFEIGRVARSIAEGHGFGSPFHGFTGLTAWYPPVYPYLLAGIFKIFGVYSTPSGVVILSLNSLFAALTCLPLFFLAERTAGRKVAIAATWLWALTPIFFPFDTRWAWETSLSTLLLMVALWAAFRLAESGDWRSWFGNGILWGVIALTNTSLLSLMPFALGWACWNSRARIRSRGLALAFVVMFLTVLPWMARNHAVMGRWIFVRDNFWAEMRFGNADQARGIWLGWMNPTINDVELDHYRAVGELQYIAEKKQAVVNFVSEHPAFFLDLCVRRFAFFWCNIPSNWEEDLSAHDVLLDQWWIICFSALAWTGMVLMLRRRPRHGWLLAPALLIYPCLYYLASADVRYRHPIEPVMLIFSAYSVHLALRERRPAV